MRLAYKRQDILRWPWNFGRLDKQNRTLGEQGGSEIIRLVHMLFIFTTNTLLNNIIM